MMTLGIAIHTNTNQTVQRATAALICRNRLVASQFSEASVTESPPDSAAWLPSKAIEACLNLAGIHAREVDALVFAEHSLVSTPQLVRLVTNTRITPTRAWQHWRHHQTPPISHDRITALRQLGLDTQRLQIDRVDTLVARAVGSWQWRAAERSCTVLSLIDDDQSVITRQRILAEKAHLQISECGYQPETPLSVLRIMAAYLGIDLDSHADNWLELCAAGDPLRYDLSPLLVDEKGSLNRQLLQPGWHSEFRQRGRGCGFSRRLVDWLGQPLQAEQRILPYPHYAAATQHLIEKVVRELIADCLVQEEGSQDLVLAGHHLHCFAGGAEGLKQRLAEHFPQVHLHLDPFPERGGDAQHAALYHQWRHGFRQFEVAD